jgi:hypothetical protein
MLIIVCAAACNRLPKGPAAPALSPAEAGRKAVAQYDKDSSGQLESSELLACPSLEIAKSRIDANGDGVITTTEIAQRITKWQNSGTTVMSGSTAVTLDGQPLEGATVTFEPEPFLGPAYKPCTGVTDSRGEATVTGADANFPGIYLGLYRVRISKFANGTETLAARYNTQSELGWEQADDLPDVHSLIEFHLTRRR